MLAQIDTSENALEVVFSGRLTFAENGEFRHVVEVLDQAGERRVSFDLSGLEFIDSAGMGMLLVAREQVAAQGGAIVLRAAGGQVGRMLHLAKFSDFFTIEDEPASAI